jgi:hypothetical protein
MTSCVDPKSLKIFKAHDIRVYHEHVQKEGKNAMPPFVGSHLARVFIMEFIGNIHFSHVCCVFHKNQWLEHMDSTHHLALI